MSRVLTVYYTLIRIIRLQGMLISLLVKCLVKNNQANLFSASVALARRILYLIVCENMIIEILCKARSTRFLESKVNKI